MGNCDETNSILLFHSLLLIFACCTVLRWYILMPLMLIALHCLWSVLPDVPVQLMYLPLLYIGTVTHFLHWYWYHCYSSMWYIATDELLLCDSIILDDDVTCCDDEVMMCRLYWHWGCSIDADCEPYSLIILKQWLHWLFMILFTIHTFCILHDDTFYFHYSSVQYLLFHDRIRVVPWYLLLLYYSIVFYAIMMYTFWYLIPDDIEISIHYLLLLFAFMYIVWVLIISIHWYKPQVMIHCDAVMILIWWCLLKPIYLFLFVKPTLLLVYLMFWYILLSYMTTWLFLLIPRIYFAIPCLMMSVPVIATTMTFVLRCWYIPCWYLLPVFTDDAAWWCLLCYYLTIVLLSILLTIGIYCLFIVWYYCYTILRWYYGSACDLPL